MNDDDQTFMEMFSGLRGSVVDVVGSFRDRAMARIDRNADWDRAVTPPASGILRTLLVEFINVVSHAFPHVDDDEEPLP